MRSVHWALAGTLTAALPLVTALPAFAGPGPLPSARGVSAPVAASGPSPFTLGCTGAGTGFAEGAAVEPSLAVNPRDPSDVVGMWQQDRATSGPGGSQGLVTGVSHDGGVHWKDAMLPGVSTCSGGTDQLASDPWLSFSDDGRTLYAASLVFDAVAPNNGILVSTSTDGGQTWTKPSTIINDTNASFVDDKESVTADPTNPNVAYVVWDRQDATTGGGQPVWYSKTTDRGQTWSAPRVLYDPTASGGSTEGNIISVLPDGSLVDVFLYAAIGLVPPDGIIRPDAATSPLATVAPAAAPSATSVPTGIRAIVSHDHGRTWSPAVTVASIGFRDHGFDPDNGKQIRDGGNIPEVAVDGRTGRIYVTWAGTGMSTSGSAIGLVSSGDGGRTWTRPIRVDQSPSSVLNGDGQAFTPNIAVTADGTVGVSYYDLRSNTSAPGLPTQRWMVTCQGAVCVRTPRVWTESHIFGPFDMELAPLITSTQEYFLGDYMGQTTVGRAFLTLTSGTTVNPNNPQKEYFQRIALGW